MIVTTNAVQDIVVGAFVRLPLPAQTPHHVMIAYIMTPERHAIVMMNVLGHRPVEPAKHVSHVQTVS